MIEVYYYSDPPKSYGKSIFLAGPTPRTPDIESWRPEALRLLRGKGYDGVVFIPEPKPEDGTMHDWPIAPQWEHKMLDIADIIIFWVPRSIELVAGNELKLPGFTTNIEFGHWANSGKAVLGYPPKTPHTTYFQFMADKFHIPISSTLEDTIGKALEIIGVGALRSGGEREIPLHVWRMRAFQNWYQAQKNAGNRLDGAKIEWLGHPYKEPKITYMVGLRANLNVSTENRNKLNEYVLLRSDISSILLYKRHKNLMKTKIVLVKEFRSPATTSDGFIWELPSGSSLRLLDPLENAIEEVYEEVGLKLTKERLHFHGSRQLAGTVLGHKSHLYSAELSDAELKWLKSQKGIPHGSDYPDNPTGEQAYTEVVTLIEIMAKNLIDWSNLGMILSVLSR